EGEFYARASGLLESVATAGPGVAYAGGAALTAAAGPRAVWALGGLVSVLVGLWWLRNPVSAPDPKPSRQGAPEGDSDAGGDPQDGPSEHDGEAERKPVFGTFAYGAAIMLAWTCVAIVGLNEHWQPDLMNGLAVVGAAIAPLTIERGDYSINGLATVLVIAVCVLGPAGATVVALSGATSDYLWYRFKLRGRMRRRAILNNILIASVGPLAAGLAASLVFAPDRELVPFVASVVVVYAVATVILEALTALFSWSEDGHPFRETFSMSTTFWADVLATQLSAFGVYVLLRDGAPGLAVMALNLVIFMELARRFFGALDDRKTAIEQRQIAEEQRDEAERLRRVAEQQRETIAYSQRFTIVKLMHALDAKDPATARHSVAVSVYLSALAEQRDMTQEMVELCVALGLLHDIGKLRIPTAILTKEGTLTDDEYNAMKLHSQYGADFVQDLDGFGDVSQIIVSHHERWDGGRGGYPQGLKGDAIPELALMINVVDSYDAQTSRKYRQNDLKRLAQGQARQVGQYITHEDAVDELIRCKGQQFRPDLVDDFITLLKSRPDLRFDPDQGRKFETRLEQFLNPSATARIEQGEVVVPIRPRRDDRLTA
ncbi:MAG TPA: HD-GYP domain-containing protein, partial [Baekduia sp.]|nr:HD-GYP domain-containing protein [Baekduia sp.]